MPLKLLVFDLDGTLIDSRLDLVHSVNATLAHLGKPALPDAVIASYIGDGAAMLIRRALGIDGDSGGSLHDEETVHQALSFFLDFYRVHKLDHTTLYPGVLEALAAIRAQHPALLMAVLTNKPVIPSREICAHFGLGSGADDGPNSGPARFFQNYGGNSFHTKKPDPLGLKTLIAEASALAGHPISPAETLMIGDSGIDILTAHNAGTRSLGCTFGLAPQTLAAAQPTALVDSPAEWLAAIQRLMDSLSQSLQSETHPQNLSS